MCLFTPPSPGSSAKDAGIEDVSIEGGIGTAAAGAIRAGEFVRGRR